MPIIERECLSCKHEDEHIETRQNADQELLKCPKCGNTTYKKKLSRSSFALNGSGWYKDGYK